MNQSTIDTTSAEYRYCLLRTAEEQAAAAPSALEQAQREQVEGMAARAFDLERRILAAREALEVIIPDAAVDDAFRALEGRYETPEEFHASLADIGLDPEGLRRALAWHLRVEAVLERVAARVKRVSATEAEIFYHTHPASFARPERRSVRHILITLNDDYAENGRDAVLSRLEGIAEEARGDISRFPDLAMRHSECPSALHGGLIGTVGRGKLYPQLDEALFAMREGALSAVVESEVGLHLLWCEAVQPARHLPLEEVLESLRDKLTERARERRRREWLAGL